MNSQLISNACIDALSAEKVRCTRYPNIHLIIGNALLVLWEEKSAIFQYRYSITKQKLIYALEKK